jgi:hypothetical protein
VKQFDIRRLVESCRRSHTAIRVFTVRDMSSGKRTQRYKLNKRREGRTIHLPAHLRTLRKFFLNLPISLVATNGSPSCEAERG